MRHLLHGARHEAASYEAPLAQIARTHGKPMARAVARGMNDPADDLGLDGGVPVGATMVLRILALGLVGVFVRFAILRRRAASQYPRALARSFGACDQPLG